MPVVKRVFDVLVSGTALVILSPLVLLIAIQIKRKLGSPVLFKQIRPGLHGKPFEMIKFRTMLDRTDANGDPLPDAERLTGFGRWLRSTSLDELPELLNVFRGEMSLVGPRPLLMEYLPLYSTEQAHRHSVRPGITGWAQINGRNDISWEEKFSLDLWYVNSRSMWLDIKIIYLTLKKTIAREGISAKGEATMAPFTGSNSE